MNRKKYNSEFDTASISHVSSQVDEDNVVYIDSTISGVTNISIRSQQRQVSDTSVTVQTIAFQPQLLATNMTQIVYLFIGSTHRT